MIKVIVGLADVDHQPGVSHEPAQHPALRAVRRILLAALVLGLGGTGTELLLLEHVEGWRQIAPIALIGVALVVLAWHAADRGRLPIRAMQGLMLLFALSGVMGVVFHYRGNAEFEREMYPSMAGFELFRESIMGATPALAPGAMIELALIGLAYTYRHPRLGRPGDELARTEEIT